LCLAIPGKIKKIMGVEAFFDFGNKEYVADISLSPEVKVGDWILMHDGRALSKVTKEEAGENLKLIKLQSKNNQAESGE
jgi:hydrogenase expression/formation protein HypC